MKSNATPHTITASQVPPYCYRLPGMSAEAGAGAAIKALNISHPCDALALLWKLRRIAREDEAEGCTRMGIARPRKNQPRPAAQAVGLLNRGVAPEKE